MNLPDGKYGVIMPLSPCEEATYRYIEAGPIECHELIYRLYGAIGAREPDNAAGNVRQFIFRLRKKLAGTGRGIRYQRGEGYSRVYEAREAA